MTDQQKSRNKIVWNDTTFEFAGEPSHKPERCKEHGGVIRRVRVLMDGKRQIDHTYCRACRLPVGKSACQRLDKSISWIQVMDFNPACVVKITHYKRPDK